MIIYSSVVELLYTYGLLISTNASSTTILYLGGTTSHGWLATGMVTLYIQLYASLLSLPLFTPYGLITMVDTMTMVIHILVPSFALFSKQFVVRPLLLEKWTIIRQITSYN